MSSLLRSLQSLRSRARLRVAVVTATMAIMSLASITTEAEAATSLSLHVQGNSLHDGNGAAIRLIGVNYSGPEYACIQGWGIFDGPSDLASVQAMAAWHINSVRIPLNEDCWLGINGVNPSYGGINYQQAIVNYVNLLHANGIYAELSLIWGAPGTTEATSQPAAPDASHSPDFWSSLAETFKSDPAVVLSPWGEPTVSWSCLLNGCSNEAGYDTAGMQQAVTLMRQAGYHGPIAIPCSDYANDCADANGTWMQFKPSDPDNQLVAEAHVYGNNACGAQSAGSCLTDTIGPLAQQVPVLFGETGETYDGSECTAANMQVILPWADAHNVSYQAWTWDTWGDCSALISNFNGTPNTTTPAGAAYPTYFHDHLIALSTTTTGADTTPPSPPTALSATPQSASQINLAWTASTDNVGVTGYDIYRNNAKLTAVATPSYADTGLAASTSYSYYVIARDAAGNSSPAYNTATATTQAPPTADVTPPTITITSPAPSATIGSSTTMAASTSDNVGVTKTELYIDGTLRATSTNSIFYIWNSRKATNGAHTITVKAYDVAGNSGDQSVTVYR